MDNVFVSEFETNFILSPPANLMLLAMSALQLQAVTGKHEMVAF